MRTLVAAAVTVAALSLSAHATITTYSSRATFDGLGTVTSVDWGLFGPAGTLISTPDFRTTGGLTVGVGSSEGILARHDQGTDFDGDFMPGDHLLTDAGSQSDTFIVRFGAPVMGFGTQIESDAMTGAWTGSVDLYDASNTLIETVAIGGTRGSAADGSAPFYGFMSDSADISYAFFWVNNPDIFPGKSGSLAINRLDVVAAAPEPPALLLSLGGLLMLGARRRRAVTVGQGD